MKDELTEDDVIDMTGPDTRIAANLIAGGLSRMGNPPRSTPHIEGREMLADGLELALRILTPPLPEDLR